MTRISNILLGLLGVAFVACTVETVQMQVPDTEIAVGEPVLFTTCVPGAATKTDAKDAFDAKMGTYKPVKADYTFTIKMYKEGQDEAVGTGVYLPVKTDEVYATDGTLSADTPLYWPDNVNKYGFEVSAGTEEIAADQSTEALFLAQDRLEGFGFEPLWNVEGDVQVDNENAKNFRTSKEWYTANKSFGVKPVEEYKKIPLYLQHKRSRITVKLKAGEGVTRESVAATANISTRIYSYDGENQLEISPLASNCEIEYTDSDYGTPAVGVTSSEFTCVVNPYDYRTNATTEPIARITLSGQHFTFYASNDRLAGDAEGEDPDAIAHMAGYNLEAGGKHLIITATLGRGSRKILITAYVVDWDETITTSIVDDYGQQGEPIQITTRGELYDFLKDPTQNKQGNVAIVVPSSMDLEYGAPWDYNSDADDSNDIDLMCTLNLAGATLYTNHQIFRNIGPAGNLVNGAVCVGDATVPSAIAAVNNGSIERVDVDPKTSIGAASSGKASQAGLVIVNTGTISQCDSNLPVFGTSGVVGGIAASSYYSPGSPMPVIDGCTVNASVNGSGDTVGGGIVGEAVGRVTNNTFAYGRTLLQDAGKFKNTIQRKYDDAEHELRAYNNSWPTSALSNGEGVPDTDVNLFPAKYDAVIDCQAELAALFTAENNMDTKRYRLSKDFSITKNGENGWTLGRASDITNASGMGNVYFKLDGDNHTLTTDVMIFTNILNDVKDITVRLSAPLIATAIDQETGEPISSAPTTGLEAIAPFAYSVSNGATISNIKVKGNGQFIQGPIVGGIVVWAYGGATIENCQCKADIQVWVPAPPAEEARIYTGGIVATAARATITRCVFHNTTATLFRNTGESYSDPAVYDDNAVLTPGIFLGGILGGTASKGTAPVEYPSVVISDCTSWLSTKREGNATRGAIVGYACYDDASSHLANGLEGGESGCQGNWWNEGSKVVGKGFGSLTEEQILGRRNAVAPQSDPEWTNE